MASDPVSGSRMPEAQVPCIHDTCRFLSDPRLDGRHPGGDGHEVAKRYLQRILASLMFKPLFDGSWFQPVMDGEQIRGENIGGFWPGRSGRSILLAAHYDHIKGIPGADDNAAALSILIEVSRLLYPWKGVHDLVLCFFDLEEPPYFHTEVMGSLYFAEHSPVKLETIDCAIVLDLCGHDISLRHLLRSGISNVPAWVPAALIPARRNGVFVMGTEFSCDLLHAVRSVERPPIAVYLFRNERASDMSDHYAFRLHGIPFLFFSSGQWEHYHQPTDTFERLNLNTLYALAAYLARLVPGLDGMLIRKLPVPAFGEIERDSIARLLLGGSPPVLTKLVSRIVSRFVSNDTLLSGP